ncbi:DsbA family protein [Candidatus Nanohalobium constans]|uniref:DSBA oxidoreductase DsbC n=1 Tax=Candidatus Nanohalobium constans TaxID=2565781 RepID=A0A5Q0UF39_9ARCH|nr:DsbA family protein [Candidatus Nanohalobium constans]QGA79961.1 DSBA oxidoreductase DsbC [Candidatus Nanohalobium constans]
MVDCDFCDESFESEEELHVHWLEEHEDKLNSHQKDDAKKSKREVEEREKQVKQRRKTQMFQGIGIVVLLGIGAVLGPQIADAVLPNNASNITVEGEPVLGSENASVTVVEYGDFQCPACNSFEQRTFSKLKTNYIDTDKARFVWKDYSLTQIHEWAEPGAEAMECVYREDEEAFWNVKSTLFNQQETIGINNVESNIIDWAGQEGVNTTEVESCIEDGDAREEVRQDKTEGQANGVTGTPTVFVNGEQVDSSYASISQAIDKELNSE